MAKLSVNINKIATLRNARGGNVPNLVKVAMDCERYGAQGITIHPRPDERHIRYSDVSDLKDVVSTEFNIEGYPSTDFIDLVLKNRPHQVTLVPDPPGVLTSNAGWDTIAHSRFLTEVISIFKKEGIRVSVFMECEPDKIKKARDIGADRIELYTEAYACNYVDDRNKAIEPYLEAASAALEAKLGINAGHDLNMDNLKFFSDQIPELAEVSIGHALISDALYFGLENTIQMYLRQLEKID
jgi:pyridoxine 5-phosphate synthase